MRLLDGINDTEDELYTFDSVIETKGKYDALEALENIGFEPLCQNEDGSYWRVRDENKEDFETIEKDLKDYKRLIEIISKYIKLDGNYDEMNSGSTKAFKICIPNCISVEEDDDYTDDCYPNADYDFIDSLLKEVLSND